MKIDDTTMTSPYPNLCRFHTLTTHSPYYTYDNDDEFKIFVSNTGIDGAYVTYQRTRVNFNGTLGAYAGLIDSVNGTSSPYIL